MHAVYLVKVEFARPERKHVITEVAGIFESKTQANLLMGGLVQFYASLTGAVLTNGLSGQLVENPDKSTVALYVEGRDFGPILN